MREVSETQAAKEWSKIKIILTEQDEIDIAQEFSKDRSKHIACWLTKHSSLVSVKKEYAAYRRQRIAWKQERIWKERTAAQWDIHRGKFMALAI